MVEEHKEGPVDEPGPLLERLEGRAHRLRGKNTQRGDITKSYVEIKMPAATIQTKTQRVNEHFTK